MLRHFNQECGGRWTKPTGLAISCATCSRDASRKSDPFDVQITRHDLRETTTTQTQPVRPCPSSCVSASPSCLRRRLCLLPASLRPERRRQDRRQAGGRPAGRPGQGSPTPGRRIRRGLQAGHRPRRQPRMRLARPPGGGPAVARRHGYRLPAPRSLRPLRLSRAPHPGRFRCVIRQGNNIDPKSPPEPQCPGACLLAESRTSLPGRRRRAGAGPGRLRRRRVTPAEAAGHRNPQQGRSLAAEAPGAAVINSPRA